MKRIERTWRYEDEFKLQMSEWFCGSHVSYLCGLFDSISQHMLYIDDFD